MKAWIAFGRGTVEVLRDDPGEVPRSAIDRFERYLEEWDAVAGRQDPFRWSGELTVEMLEYLTNWLYRTGVRLAADAEAGIGPTRPPAADKFRVVLIRAMLAALEREGPAPAQFAEQIRAQWGPVAGRD